MASLLKARVGGSVDITKAAILYRLMNRMTDTHVPWSYLDVFPDNGRKQPLIDNDAWHNENDLVNGTEALQRFLFKDQVSKRIQVDSSAQGLVDLCVSVNGLDAKDDLTSDLVKQFPSGIDIAQHFMRERDFATLIQHDPVKAEELREYVANDPRFTVKGTTTPVDPEDTEDPRHLTSMHEHLAAWKPSTQRGLAYFDLGTVPMTVEEQGKAGVLLTALCKEWPMATKLVTFPISGERPLRYYRDLLQTGQTRILTAELYMDTTYEALEGVGMAVVNPPEGFDAEIAAVLDDLGLVFLDQLVLGESTYSAEIVEAFNKREQTVAKISDKSFETDLGHFLASSVSGEGRNPNARSALQLSTRKGYDLSKTTNLTKEELDNLLAKQYMYKTLGLSASSVQDYWKTLGLADAEKRSEEYMNKHLAASENGLAEDDENAALAPEYSKRAELLAVYGNPDLDENGEPIGNNVIDGVNLVKAEDAEEGATGESGSSGKPEHERALSKLYLSSFAGNAAQGYRNAGNRKTVRENEEPDLEEKIREQWRPNATVTWIRGAPEEDHLAVRYDDFWQERWMTPRQLNKDDISAPQSQKPGSQFFERAEKKVQQTAKRDEHAIDPYKKKTTDAILDVAFDGAPGHNGKDYVVPGPTQSLFEFQEQEKNDRQERIDEMEDVVRMLETFKKTRTNA